MDRYFRIHKDSYKEQYIEVLEEGDVQIWDDRYFPCADQERTDFIELSPENAVRMAKWILEYFNA